MGNTDTDDATDERRAFVRTLRTHEDVRRLTFSRDGYRTVVFELEPDAEFRDEWYRTATRLGYDVERLGADGSLPDWPNDAWFLRLSETDGGSALARAVRGTLGRLRASLGRLLRLLGRSGR